LKKIFVSIVIFTKDFNNQDFKIWTQVRLEPGPLFQKLEFPGGKIELGETPKQAAAREVEEEVGVNIKDAKGLTLFKIQDYEFNGKFIVLYVFISPFDQLPKDKGEWLLIDYQQKSAYLTGKIPEINHVIIDELAVYIEKIFKGNLLEQLWTTSN
jgi:mutator protein MutT